VREAGRSMEKRTEREQRKEQAEGDVGLRGDEGGWLSEGTPGLVMTGDNDGGDGLRRVVDTEVEVRGNGEGESVSTEEKKRVFSRSPQANIPSSQ